VRYYVSPFRLGCGSVFFAIAVWAIWDGVGRGALLRHRAATWNTTTGVIEQYKAACHVPNRVRSPEWCEIALSYRYTVGERPYLGNRYALSGNAVYTLPRWFERFKSLHAPGDTVTVYYDPADPSRAVLSRYVDQAWGLAFLGLLGLLVFVILFLLPLGWLYRLAGLRPETADEWAREDYEAERGL
jgi:uncharacterized protein DUF3592